MAATNLPVSIIERLKRHFIPTADDSCWLWTGAISSQGGYPGFTDDDGRFIYAHRAMYEQTYGPIPDKHHVHHTCSQRACIRPEHLEALSPEEHRARHSNKYTIRRIAYGMTYRNMKQAGFTTKRIAELFGVSGEWVRRCIREVNKSPAIQFI